MRHVRKRHPGEICAHHRSARRARLVSGIEVAASQDRNPKRRERIATDDALLHGEAAAVDGRTGERAAADARIPRMVAAGRRQTGETACGRHSRDRFQPAGQRFEEGRAARRVVPRRRQVHLEGQDALDAKAERDSLQLIEACQQDSRTGEQRQRECDLRGHERATQPRHPSSDRDGTRLLTQRIDWMDASETQQRRNTERHRGGRGGEQREGEDAGVDVDFAEPRQRVATEALQHADAEGGQGESEHAAEGSQQQALDQELANEPLPARTERSPHGELAHASGRTHEHQVGDVDAREQQDERNRGEHQEQQAARVRDQLFVQRQGDDRALFRRRPAFQHRQTQRREFRLCAFQADAIAHAADGAQRVVLLIRVLGKAGTEPTPRRR